MPESTIPACYLCVSAKSAENASQSWQLRTINSRGSVELIRNFHFPLFFFKLGGSAANRDSFVPWWPPQYPPLCCFPAWAQCKQAHESRGSDAAVHAVWGSCACVTNLNFWLGETFTQDLGGRAMWSKIYIVWEGNVIQNSHCLHKPVKFPLFFSLINVMKWRGFGLTSACCRGGTL